VFSISRFLFLAERREHADCYDQLRFFAFAVVGVLIRDVSAFAITPTTLVYLNVQAGMQTACLWSSCWCDPWSCRCVKFEHQQRHLHVVPVLGLSICVGVIPGLADV
jgi:hypothetical protein